MAKRGFWLKVAIFATGISGLTAEFILSTLASYFIGDTIIQWTVVLSIMLFAMGVGSRLSRFVKKKLLISFLLVEFTLSLCISFSPLLVYSIAARTEFIHLLIYGLALLIGALIGFEIPLATRLNEEHEELEKNISNILSWDYIGSLVGGLLFAFWGLPYLGITNTAFTFGTLNFMVALILFFQYKKYYPKQQVLIGAISLLMICAIGLGFFYSEKVILFGEQSRYKDKIVYREQSRYQKIVVTQWKEHFWLFINGNQQLSTLDEFLYHEPMVHPVMQLLKEPKDVLIIGGGDGFNAKELLKYDAINNITLVDLDPAMTKLGLEFEGLLRYNDSALHDPKVNILNKDGFTFLKEHSTFYDLIIVDLPDAKSIDLNKLYTLEFYQMAYRLLRPYGHFITQAGSPYYATKANHCIDKTMNAAGFKTLQLHNQVLTLGEWGWIIGSKQFDKRQMIERMKRGNYEAINTKWLSRESIDLISSFGKPLFDTAGVKINTINNPVLYKYYLDGNWDLY